MSTFCVPHGKARDQQQRRQRRKTHGGRATATAVAAAAATTTGRGEARRKTSWRRGALGPAPRRWRGPPSSTATGDAWPRPRHVDGRGAMTSDVGSRVRRGGDGGGRRWELVTLEERHDATRCSGSRPQHARTRCSRLRPGGLGRRADSDSDSGAVFIPPAEDVDDSKGRLRQGKACGASCPFCGG